MHALLITSLKKVYWDHILPKLDQLSSSLLDEMMEGLKIVQFMRARFQGCLQKYLKKWIGQFVFIQ